MADEDRHEDHANPNDDKGRSDEKERSGLLSALEAERAKRHELELQLAKQEGRAEAATQNRQDPPKEYSRAELQRRVDDGQMTEAEMDEILDRQTEQRLERKLETQLEQKTQQQTRSQQINSEIDRYVAIAPDVNKEGSDTRERVATAFQDFVKWGDDPKDPATELKALRAALGPVTALEKAAKTQGSRESYEEHSGGTGGEDDGSKVNRDGSPKGLTQREREHYKRMIDKGMYKGWDDPNIKKELELRDPALARRAQARSAA